MRRTLYVKLGLAGLVLLLGCAVYIRLIAGPVSLNDYTKGVGESLAGRIGPGWTVGFQDAALELDGARPAVRASGLEIRNPGGVVVVRAPVAFVSLDPLSLLTGNVALRAIELRDLQLRALVAEDGSLSFVPQSDADPVPAAPASAPAAPKQDGRPLGSPVSQAVASLLQPVLSPNGIVGALNRAVITNARLTLVGRDGRERVGFSRVGARFEQLEPGKREISVDLEGPHGTWHIGGTAEEDGHKTQRVALQVSDVPVADVLLLAGLSSLPSGSDLKLSAEVSSTLIGRRIATLGGRFWSNKGAIELPDKDHSIIHVEQVSGTGNWDELARKLSLSDLIWRNGDTQVRLAAEMAEDPEPHAWSVDLSGQDAILNGESAEDQPVKIDRIAGRVHVNDSGLVLDGLSVIGPDLNASVSGTLDVDKRQLHSDIEAQHTEARRLIRLWPNSINPELRRYIAANLKAGMVERLSLVNTLDGPDLTAAFGADPVSDRAVKLSAAISNGTLIPSPGLPALQGLNIEGAATGTTANLTATEAHVDLPDGRRLALTEGSYRQTEMTRPGSTARIGFRMGGGADALASLLRLPSFHDAFSFDFDPAAVKGQVDLRVELPLQYDRLPKNAGEVPVAITGTIADLSIDKVYGKEKLEGANLALTSDPSTLVIKGDGKLSGSPATLELRQPRGQGGDLAVSLLLDDQARARRGLPSAPQLRGPVQVKVTAPMGAPASGKAAARVEADLGRASIDGLLPGWTKSAGQPGRVSFSLADASGRELRDFAIEAGPVQLRGNLTMGEDGGLDHAEFASLKLSPGDDMRAQVEHSGGVYRVNLKGNVGDARPLIKQITAGPSGSGKGGRDGDRGRGDGADVDLDLALNIMTGNNEEAMTGVSGKVSLRRGEMRALQFSGRFRGAGVEAQLGGRGVGGYPVLTVQSGDAGATLRFLDIYKRMAGGKLLLNATLGQANQTGRITIEAFSLRNEPALRRILAQGPSPTEVDERGRGGVPRAEADQVYFTKLVGDFQRSAGRMDYRDVVIYGAQVGFTLSGFVDNARDRIDINGTFVPAYGLNNAFSQVPIVGLLLGGGNRNEGLFAVDFRISGLASSPTLNVNPLSAVAPGILRKFFGWAMPDGTDVPTGTTAPHSSER